MWKNAQLILENLYFAYWKTWKISRILFSSYSPKLNLYTCNRMQCPIEIFEGIFGLQKICMFFSAVHIWTAVYALKICSFYSYRTYALPFQNIPCSQIRNRIRGQIVHQALKPPLKNYARSFLQWLIPIVCNKSLVPISVNSSSPKYGVQREPPPPLKFKKSL